MKPCPNCQQPVEAGINLCPNCGADTRPLWAEQVAPGLLQLDGLDLTQRKRKDRRDLILGFIMGLGLGSFLPLIGTIIAIITCLAMGKRPYFAKGMLWGGLAGILGAVLLCFGLIGHR